MSIDNHPIGGVPTKGKPSLYQTIKTGLGIAARAIISAPVKLPPKLVQGAQYVALLIGLLDAVDAQRKQERLPEETEGGTADAP